MGNEIKMISESLYYILESMIIFWPTLKYLEQRLTSLVITSKDTPAEQLTNLKCSLSFFKRKICWKMQNLQLFTLKLKQNLCHLNVTTYSCFLCHNKILITGTIFKFQIKIFFFFWSFNFRNSELWIILTFMLFIFFIVTKILSHGINHTISYIQWKIYFISRYIFKNLPSTPKHVISILIIHCRIR